MRLMPRKTPGTMPARKSAPTEAPPAMVPAAMEYRIMLWLGGTSTPWTAPEMVMLTA